MASVRISKNPPKKGHLRLAIEFNDFIEHSAKLSHFVTFTLASCSRRKIDKEKVLIMLKDIYFWFSVVNVCLMVSFCAVSTIEQSFDLSALTYLMTIVSSTANLVVKCLVAFLNKSKISAVLDQLKRIFPNKRHHKKYHISTYLKSFTMFVKLYSFLMFTTCCCVISIPLIKLFRSGQRTLPLNIRVSFDGNHNGTYALIYLCATWACANSVIVVAAIDSLMFGMITLVSMEFNILKNRFEDLKHESKGNVERQTRNLIQRHSELIECSKCLEKIFSPTFLFNFLQSSFVICLTAFQYTTSSEPVDSIFNLSYCAAMLNQIWLLCFFGQKIIDSSTRIADGVYDSGWEKIENAKVRKALNVIIQRAQKPTKLTAMSFMDVSLKSFRSVNINFN